MYNGGNSNSEFNETIFGGNSNSEFNETIFGGNSVFVNNDFKDLIAIMNNKLIGNYCWSDFNKEHRYYQFLKEFSMTGSFYQPSDVPIEPIPADNPYLDC